MDVTRILLADDHQVVRLGMRSLLEAQSDFEIIGEAGDGPEAIQLAGQLQPDLIVLDLMLPHLNGIEVMHQIQSKYPDIRIVILSMYDNEAYVVEALAGGASAYVLKQSTSDDLVQAIRNALAGKHYLSPILSERAIDTYIKYFQTARTGEMDPYETLTPRECEVLNLAAQGHSNAEIAAKLSLSPRTVETHRANMMHKLGFHSQVDLARFALERKIIPK
ncbi:MAG: response regulator transcription factor [Anaerolineaceae bacterium]|nr:response regulator transcription factor [Anaerolineaceae bacterium]